MALYLTPTFLAYLLFIGAVGFGLLFMFAMMSDGESMNDEDATLDVQNHHGDTRPVR